MKLESMLLLDPLVCLFIFFFRAVKIVFVIIVFILYDVKWNGFCLEAQNVNTLIIHSMETCSTTFYNAPYPNEITVLLFVVPLYLCIPPLDNSCNEHINGFQILLYTYLKIQNIKKMTDNLCNPILPLVFSLIVNISCVIFVSWKSTECFIKYFNNPQGTKVDIKHSGNTGQFPCVTICALNTDKIPPGIRWNISHLNKCGIKG